MGNSLKEFGNQSQQSMQGKYALQKSRQAKIGSRLIQIRLEMQKLQSQLNDNLFHQEQMQQQAQQAVSKDDDTKKEKAQYLMNKAKHDHAQVKNQLQQFSELKEKLTKMYQLQGFKTLVRQNPNMSQFLGVIRQDFVKEGTDDLISAQITGRSTNMMDFSRMLERMNSNINKQAEAKDQFTKNPSIKVNIMYDKSLKDVGVMVRMNNLMKRVEVINYLIGNWKSSNNKFVNITEQVKYVQKRLELLDESKLVFYQQRADILKQEIDEVWKTKERDGDVLNKKSTEVGGKKKAIEDLYNKTKTVKLTSEQLPQFVDRLEQKKKVHDMAGHILLTIEKLEQQQQNILNCATKENKEVVQALQNGMKENQETIKNNIAMLKQKIGISETDKK